MLTAAVLRQERYFEMPKKMRDENMDKYGYEARGTFGTQSPYYQPVSAISHAKNTVNQSNSASNQNLYKRDRSSSNNARRPPIPGS